jgi:hypothetical protein
MTKTKNVGKYYPGFSEDDVRMHFENPVSFSNSTNYDRYELVENFAQLPSINASIGVDTNLNFEILGTGASADDVTFGTTVGGILLTTDSSASQEVIVLPHLDTSQTAWANVKWGTENQVIWEAVIRTGASVADVVIWAGLKLTNTATVATDANQAFFRFDGVVANWEATYSISGTDTEVDSGVAVAVNTNYYLRIEIDSDRKAHFYIDDVLVAVSTAMTNDVDLIPYIGVQGNAKTLYIVKEKISRIIFE